MITTNYCIFCREKWNILELVFKIYSSTKWKLSVKHGFSQFNIQPRGIKHIQNLAPCIKNKKLLNHIYSKYILKGSKHFQVINLEIHWNISQGRKKYSFSRKTGLFKVINLKYFGVTRPNYVFFSALFSVVEKKKR